MAADPGKSGQADLQVHLGNASIEDDASQTTRSPVPSNMKKATSTRLSLLTRSSTPAGVDPGTATRAVSVIPSQRTPR